MSFVTVRFVILFQLIGGLFSYFAGMLALFQSRCPKSKEWNPLIYSRTEVVNLFDYAFSYLKSNFDGELLQNCILNFIAE